MGIHWNRQRNAVSGPYAKTRRARSILSVLFPDTAVIIGEP